ncbi:MAG: polyprenyl synthetase family protein [Nitrospirae bacterium]|nr:polyprenyl synthetase family protein [Nitrospirota bacterium]
MMIQEIWDFYQKDLKEVEDRIKNNLKAHVPAISAVGNYLLQGGGKRIRPLLLILSSRLSGYKGEKEIILAGIIESIHTASLLHDDVVDGAKMRRGRASAHSIWGNQVVILVGDFLYSNALMLAVSMKNQKIMDALSWATTRMTEGELFQLDKIADSDISEEDYIRIIRDKTAMLMSAACKVGAILGEAGQVKEDALGSFGLKVGLAFQMVDDILDYMADRKALGKNLGKDLEEGKITLPIIYLLKQVNKEEVNRIKRIINSKTTSRKDLDYIADLLNKYGSISRSYAKAQQLVNEAKTELDVFKDSDEKTALLAIADYSLRRKR